MALLNHDQAKIRQYLLGHLSDEEQQKIEERLMVEDDLFEELDISKGELIEEYHAGELNQTERQWFEGHYLASPEGRQRYTFTVALNCIKRPVPAPQSLTFSERVAGFLQKWRWATAIAVPAALVVVIALGLQFFRPIQTYPSQTSYAFSLNSTLSQRSSGNGRYYKVPLTPEIEELRVNLQLPDGIKHGTDYRVELDDRREIRNLKVAALDATSVLVVIPAAQVPEGFYALRLYSRNDDGSEQLIPGEYLFLTK